MNITAIDQFQLDILEIVNIHKIAEGKFNEEQEHGFPDPSDFRAHTILELCIVSGVSAFEYYLKERLKSRLDIDKLTKKYTFQSLDSVIKLLDKELGIKYPSLNLTRDEIISLKILFAWRHIIVHNGKRMDHKFIEKVAPLYRRLGLIFNYQEGDRVLFEPRLIEDFIDNLEKLVRNLDPLI